MNRSVFFRGGRRGASLVIFALSLMTILAFCGLTIDVGHWYHVKARLQSNSDAAALAGCVKLPSASEAEANARDYAFRNNCTNAEIISLRALPVGAANPRQFEVVLERIAGPFFTGLLGFQTVRIRARALAETSTQTLPTEAVVGKGTALDFAVYSGQEFDTRGRVNEFAFSGGGLDVVGSIHVNGSIRFTGAGTDVNGSVRAGHDISGTPSTLTGTLTQNVPKVPIPTIDQAGIIAAAKAAGQYYEFVSGVLKRFDPATNTLVNTSPPPGWSVNGTQLHQNDNSGTLLGNLYLQGGDIHINGNGVGGTGVLATSGEIHLNANSGTMRNTSELAFISFSTSEKAIQINGNGQTLEGAMVAPNGGIDLSGNGNTMIGSLVQLYTAGFSGNNNRVIFKEASVERIPLARDQTFVRLIE